jgi:hypothetical protein
MRELAKRIGFNENYVSRIMDLAVLSPEMTEAIFGGDHDPSLTVAQLIANLEIDWTRQGLPQIDDFGQVPRASMPLLIDDQQKVIGISLWFVVAPVAVSNTVIGTARNLDWL